jgi:hypothetical protein
MNALRHQALDNLLAWVRSQNYSGWDPYDAMTSPALRHLPGHYPKFLAIQFNKFFPLNVRPVLGVKKGIDTKGLILFTRAFCRLYQLNSDERYRAELERVLALVRSRSRWAEYGHHCWSGHYFPVFSIDKGTWTESMPDTVTTSFAIMALAESGRVLGDKTCHDMAMDAAEHLISTSLRTINETTYFAYSFLETSKDVIVLNASGLALDALSHVLSLKEDSRLKETGEQLASLLIRTQRDDGAWVYSLRPDGSVYRDQRDFHQGYILDGLQSFLPFADDPEHLRPCIERGARYYRDILFRKDGSSYYRYPVAFPVDIHNQAQGIITFSKLIDLEPAYRHRARSITEWTITHMQDREGFFYFQKWPLVLNRTPHMRWGQAWMMLALATCLCAEKRLSGTEEP